MGLMGGTFDPVHIGHLLAAQAALEAFQLDRVVFIPSAVPPHKRHAKVADATHRLAMLRLAVKGLPQFAVSTVELDRGGVSFTVDTLTALRAAQPDWDLWFIVGMDSLRELHLWHRTLDLLELCTVATLERPGVDTPLDAVPGLPAAWSQQLLRHVAPGRRVDVSSSEIRSRIAEKRPIRYLVPCEVETYIRTHRLYAADGPATP
jgi:nicotinate-nucleotide adenylyltransferase